MAELIFSSDTLDQGRIKINQFYSGGTNILTANTSNTVWLITGNTNVGSSTLGFAFGLSGNVTSGAYGLISNGLTNTVSNNFSTVINGRGNTSSAQYSFIGNGTGNTASGTRSFVGNGKGNIGQAQYSFIGNGNNNRVLNSFTSVINGNTNRCYSSYSFIGNGKNNSLLNSSSNYSVLLNGSFNSMLSNCDHSFIMGGSNTMASSNYALIFGKLNTISSASYSIAIGNGALSTTSKEMVFAAGAGNTIKFDFNAGDGYFDGGSDVGNADYAEYFEWEDGNLNEENRYGFSVSLVKDGKIKISNKNIIGIVSSTPGVVGDSAELNWNKKYKTDEWGIKQTESFDKVSIMRKDQKINIWIDKNGKQYFQVPRNQKERLDYFIDEFYELTPEESKNKQKDIIFLYSDEYDPKSDYIPRSERKEFSTIGLLGKLRVRTAEQINSEYVDFNSQGMAVNGSKYQILEKIKEYDGQYGIVKIFFK